MPMLEETASVTCPYCGQPVDLVVDISAGTQAYVEDCGVCCQPIEVEVTVDAQGGFQVNVNRGDE